MDSSFDVIFLFSLRPPSAAGMILKPINRIVIPSTSTYLKQFLFV